MSCFYSPGSKCELKAKLGLNKTEDMTATNIDAFILLIRLQMFCRTQRLYIKIKKIMAS